MKDDHMTKWEYTSVNVGPGESWYDQLRNWGANGWEAWHIEKNEAGWREIYFKRPSPSVPNGMLKSGDNNG